MTNLEYYSKDENRALLADAIDCELDRADVDRKFEKQCQSIGSYITEWLFSEHRESK